jgi:hypothetical protein
VLRAVGRNLKKWLVISLVILLITSTTAFIGIYYLAGKTVEADCYVGVSYCGDTVAEAKLLIDRVKTYTNLFVLQSGPVSENESATNEICDYAVDAGLKIIVFFGDLTPTKLEEKGLAWRLSWLNTTMQRWGDRFLGVYYYDEPGGIQLDCNWNEYDIMSWNATIDEPDYDAIADLIELGFQLDPGFEVAKESSPSLFVSDYALYWWDFLLGYDVVLAQVGWNHTLAQDISLVRGAARLQGKSWGAIITWKYTDWPYLDDDEAIYYQMYTAYKAGAEYLVIFNYPQIEGKDYGVMDDDHFGALERFWNDAVRNSWVVHGSLEAEAVLVLPRNYGWGMRYPEDRIWGWWGPDEKSHQIWNITRQLLEQHGASLDIVYDDPAFPTEGIYKTVYYWNQTTTFE